MWIVHVVKLGQSNWDGGSIEPGGYFLSSLIYEKNYFIWLKFWKTILKETKSWKF
jgi:hypothetical protein